MNWSHAFRQILRYHDILDFPNKLDSWSNLLHPEDYDRVMQLLLETIADKTNTTKYNVEYRLKMQDGQYQWFRASAEVIRRLDGSANRIAGIISNIDAEKEAGCRPSGSGISPCIYQRKPLRILCKSGKEHL